MCGLSVPSASYPIWFFTALNTVIKMSASAKSSPWLAQNKLSPVCVPIGNHRDWKVVEAHWRPKSLRHPWLRHLHMRHALPALREWNALTRQSCIRPRLPVRFTSSCQWWLREPPQKPASPELTRIIYFAAEFFAEALVHPSMGHSLWKHFLNSEAEKSKNDFQLLKNCKLL